MLYNSTRKQSPNVTFKEAIINVIAPDNGLYMPERIRFFPPAFYKNLAGMSLQEIAFIIAESFWGEDIPADKLQEIVYETLNFDIPLIKLEKNRYVLELFHGPTLSYKDIGTRFLTRFLNYFHQQTRSGAINILIATTGNTGAAAANSFWSIKGIHVYILYPRESVCPIQEKQFASLGENITAIAVDGSFEDCKAIIKQALLDKELNRKMTLTSANSINIACLLPQSFYFFYAYSQLLRTTGKPEKVAFSIPNNSPDNLIAGIIAKQMGLPINRFIATTAQDRFPTQTQPSDKTLSSVPNQRPSTNEAIPDDSERIKMLCERQPTNQDIEYTSYSTEDIPEILQNLYGQNLYPFGIYGAVNYHSMKTNLHPDEIGISLETTHPIKYGKALSETINKELQMPANLQPFIHSKNKNLFMPPLFADFKSFLLQQTQST